MTSNFTSHLSNTLKCATCGFTLGACSCPNFGIVSGGSVTSSGTGGLFSGTTTGAYGPSTQTVHWQYPQNYMNCSTCARPINACICSYHNLLNPTPSWTPQITQPAPWITTTHTTIWTEPFLIEYDVMGIQNKLKYPATGPLRILSADPEAGFYLKGQSLTLPIDVKEVFYQLRKHDGLNLWQLRAPLNFRIDFAWGETDKKPRFFTLADIEGCTQIESEQPVLDITTPFFQEITDQLELIRLVEIEDTFVKLLRRL